MGGLNRRLEKLEGQAADWKQETPDPVRAIHRRIMPLMTREDLEALAALDPETPGVSGAARVALTRLWELATEPEREILLRSLRE